MQIPLILKPLFGLGLVRNEWHTSSKIYGKQDDFSFVKVNFPFLKGKIRTFYQMHLL